MKTIISLSLCSFLYVRCGNDDLSVDELLVELGVLALLVGGGDEGVALVLEPFADAELVLCGSEELGDLEVRLACLFTDNQTRRAHICEARQGNGEVL